MKRYGFLEKEIVFEALNKLRNAFLAAKDGTEVEQIIKAVVTWDERMKIGRRIQVAQALLEGKTYEEIVTSLHVGRATVKEVDKLMDQYADGFELINKREEKVEATFHQKAIIEVGGPMLVRKIKKYSGFKRKDVKR